MNAAARSRKRWSQLLGKLEELAEAYGTANGATQETAFTAMHCTLTTIATIAAMHRAGPADGWTAILTYAPQLDETGLNVGISIRIIGKSAL